LSRPVSPTADDAEPRTLQSPPLDDRPRPFPMTTTWEASAPPVAAALGPLRSEHAKGFRAELSTLDRMVYEAVAKQHTPALDRPLRGLSQVANKSALWALFAATLAAMGGRRGRIAATRGMIAIGVTSALCNLGLKPLYNRRRPVVTRLALPEGRRVRVPDSSSFPSGHAASAFAFATAVGIEMPLISLPLHALAALVAYSRVHTGVHYPGDVIAGAVIGTATGQIVTRLADRFPREGITSPDEYAASEHRRAPGT
jgi:hypothetical protein